jgi:uncharacterized protein YqgQ
MGILIENKIPFTREEYEEALDDLPDGDGVFLTRTSKVYLAGVPEIEYMKRWKIFHYLRGLYEATNDLHGADGRWVLHTTHIYLNTGYLHPKMLNWVKNVDKELYDYLLIRNSLHYVDRLFVNVTSTIQYLYDILNYRGERPCADDDLFELIEMEIKELYDLLTSRNRERLKKEIIIKKQLEEEEIVGCVVPREKVEDFMKSRNISGDLVLQGDGWISPFYNDVESKMKEAKDIDILDKIKVRSTPRFWVEREEELFENLDKKRASNEAIRKRLKKMHQSKGD